MNGVTNEQVENAEQKYFLYLTVDLPDQRWQAGRTGGRTPRIFQPPITEQPTHPDPGSPSHLQEQM